jgi:geranyl diphosphate synthase
VVELLSTVIEHLVKGEIMQMKPSATGRSALDYYLRKNFYKTASLMGHSCLAAAVLGTCCAAVRCVRFLATLATLLVRTYQCAT